MENARTNIQMHGPSPEKLGQYKIWNNSRMQNKQILHTDILFTTEHRKYIECWKWDILLFY